MFYIFLGFIAFLLFIVYDINSIIMKHKIFDCCFFVGFFLLTVATIGVVITSWALIKVDAFRMGIFGVFTVIFLYLLIDTLFFAIPFKSTYLNKEESPKICQSGVYALCRHPGVLWFMGFYTFLGLALMIPLLLTAAVIFSILNILYVIFQDRWTFMKSFENYDKYKENTPFLLPNLKSIKRCLKSLSQKGTII